MPTENNRLTRFGLLARTTLLLWPAVILVALVAAPWAASAGRAEGWFLYEAFEAVCHQQPERSWHLLGHPLAVCVRCVGFYAGVLLAAVLGLRLPPNTVAAALALAGLLWIAESFDVVTSGQIRFVAGLVFGLSLCAAILESTGIPQAQSEKTHGEYSTP